MPKKGLIRIDSADEIKQIEKDLVEEAKYAVAAAKGIKPADAVINKIGRASCRERV